MARPAGRHPCMQQIRVLIADDSALMRQTLRHIVESDRELEVVAVARDGEDAVLKAREVRPDVIAMDINMPKLDGISALQIILQEKICPVVMVSSLTQAGAATTFECLELGAFDYVAKPDGTVSRNMGAVAGELTSKLKAASRSGVLDRVRRRRAASTQPAAAVRAVRPVQPARLVRPGRKAVAIGISTGGPATLMEVLPMLPADLDASVFLVQHMPGTFITSFARRLDDHCDLKVVEAKAGMIVETGVCYVASGGVHLCLFEKANGDIVIRTPGRPETLFIPSVDVMMESVLRVYGTNTIGVLMTGIGDDGADQMAAIRNTGGYTIAESEETAVVFGMPAQAIQRGGADAVLPSFRVAAEIAAAVGRS
jgi:two-component system, chemotaxis family, protein-glutamate methylesterase/glutaminase